MKQVREFIAVIMWTAAISLMVGGTADSIRDGGEDVKVLVWGLFVGLGAHQVTAWCCLRRHHHQQEDEAVNVERIVEIVAALHEQRDVHRLR